MKILYVHIGTPKTGTTAIQHFCADNQKLLNKKGYCYPLFPEHYEGVGLKRNAHFLVEEDFENEQGIFWKRMASIRELFRIYPNLILSDEGIWAADAKRRMSLLKILKREGEACGFLVKIIVYLRRQDLYLSSVWNQHIKKKSQTKTWSEYILDLKRTPRLNYGTKLEKIANIIGKENIIVRRFESKSFTGGSLYADFLQAVDLEFTGEYRISKYIRNTRLAGNTHEIMRIINSISYITEEQRKFFRRALLSYADLSGEEYPHEMFSREEAEEFMESYKEANQKIAETYLKEEELFDMTWRDIPKWNKDNIHMQDDLIRFVAVCTSQIMNEIEELRRRMDKQLEQATAETCKRKNLVMQIAMKQR